jgi:hypothetical protein
MGVDWFCMKEGVAPIPETLFIAVAPMMPP